MKLIFSILIAVAPAVTSFQVTSSINTPRLSNLALNAEVNGGSADKKKVIVLGGDGFCGWPTSLYLSDQGHDVVIVDNLSRRNIDIELGCDSLTPISSPQVRTLTLKLLTTYSQWHRLDLGMFISMNVTTITTTRY